MIAEFERARQGPRSRSTRHGGLATPAAPHCGSEIRDKCPATRVHAATRRPTRPLMAQTIGSVSTSPNAGWARTPVTQRSTCGRATFSHGRPIQRCAAHATGTSPIVSESPAT